ncbi:MAG TPA: 16S rRNA (cytosine(967)-C(5))-methyltransferase RsmB [Candidatus Acidoferrales bacterium]|nr:16S rRNA (cytosine(967)-C(5))-methyltransferase RsmB [Candidatus Acidoferrales bacterium]
MSASPHSKNNSIPQAKPSARAIAYSVLLAVETRAAYASELLHSRMSSDIAARDAALATELVMGTLRWQRALDFFIARYTGRTISALDAEVLIALRMGIYQLRHLTRIPARAAVNESVELVRRARKKSAVPLANAALRRAAAEKSEPLTSFLPAGMDATEALAIEHSHPTWMVERWLRKFGEPKTIELLEWNNHAPKQACAILNPARREETIRSLEEAGLHVEAGRLLKDAIVVSRGNVAKTAALRNGWIAIQDEASQAIPLLLDAQGGESVLDLCAAPGGKTIALAQRAGARGHVVACDIYEARLRVMRERLHATGTNNVSLVILDGTSDLPFGRRFDRILVDAPCSGTGTLARNPEIRWRLRAEDLAELRVCQVKLLASALAHLAPNGKLLYSTCSMEAEENESVIQEALAKSPDFRIEPVKVPQSILVEGVRAENLTDGEGAFRTFPPAQHSDGFFAAAIRRR